MLYGYSFNNHIHPYKKNTNHISIGHICTYVLYVILIYSTLMSLYQYMYFTFLYDHLHKLQQHESTNNLLVN